MQTLNIDSALEKRENGEEENGGILNESKQNDRINQLDLTKMLAKDEQV